MICKLCDHGMLTVLFEALLLVNMQLIFLICLHLIHSERHWFNRKSRVCASSWGKQKKVTHYENEMRVASMRKPLPHWHLLDLLSLDSRDIAL